MTAWLNLTDYTAPQLAFYVTGAWLWVVAYVIYIRNGFKYRVVEMPAFAAAGNIGWEFCYALLFTANLGAASVYAHKAWFVLDVLIFYLVLRYGSKQTDIPMLQRRWVPVCIAVAVASGVFYGTFVRQGFDVGSTIQSAYVCQLPISFLYIPLMLRQKSLVGYSMWTAWTRTLGTGLIGVFAFMRYPDLPFLLSMAVIATLVDFIYIYLFAQRRRQLAAAAMLAIVMLSAHGGAQQRPAQTRRAYTHADSLRGSNGPGRAWWDATFYDLHVAISPVDSSIRGWNGITYRVLKASQRMQVDLQPPLVVDSIRQGGADVKYARDGNALFLTLTRQQRVGAVDTVSVYYHGKPVAAKNPPWGGGFIWQHDSAGNPWVATANEGLGASVWWPNKDWFGDEPDSQRVAITVPDSMIDVSNGRLRSRKRNGDGTTTYEWFVYEPINNYDVAVNAGTYEHFFSVYQGEAGTLSLDFWPLRIHLADARKQWAQVTPMLKCFEHWFGPYPWYRDGYKLVEAPHLGMEHQSAVAYGNKFENGYLGRDLSGTGRGSNWDFIIVHESAHEWWGNSLTASDAAYMWIHESFANYAENLYVECLTGDKQAGAEYVIGTRKLIRNDRPIEGDPGVNDEGSGNDHYYKGGNLLHLIRQLVGDDGKWRNILRGLQSTFRHQTVSGPQVEQYITRESGLPLQKVFDQYLRTTNIPALEYTLDRGKLAYRWTNVVEGFAMPVLVHVPGRGEVTLRPTARWTVDPGPLTTLGGFAVDANYYVTAKEVASRGR